jgi:hypothetical protein
MENYKAGWAMGDLSATSVFHMFVLLSLPAQSSREGWKWLLRLTDSSPVLPCSFIVLASSNKLTRRIFNSPTFAEPCLVASAKQILLPENW